MKIKLKLNASLLIIFICLTFTYKRYAQACSIEINESIIELKGNDLPKDVYLVEVKNEIGSLVQKINN